MADQLKFINKLVKELGIHENIVTWNTWQEISYGFGGEVCYCPNTIKAYQRWLQGLYGDIAALNGHWNVRYASFESVLPDRRGHSSSMCIAQSFYYDYFMANVQIANVLSCRREAIKDADPLSRPVFAHKGGPELGSGVDWTYAGTQDFFGTSNYPAWGNGHAWDDHRQKRRLERHEALLTEMWDGLAYRMDHIRSASKDGAPVWGAEYQGGPVNTDFHRGRVPDAGDMRRWLLTSMAAGATGISFWVARAEIMAPETNGFSLLDSEGDTTERLEESSRVGCALGHYPDLFAENNRQAEDAALFIDEWNYRLLQTLKDAPDAYKYDMRGWYKHLWSRGVACRSVEASQLDGAPDRYKTLIAPMALSMSDKTASKLAAFAEKGGVLILEGGCGRLSETAYAVRGLMNPVIRKALGAGVKVDRFGLVREPGDTDRWSVAEYTWGEFEDAGFLIGEGVLAGHKFRANVFVETYDETDGVCLRWNGKPAGLCRQVGSGYIAIAGTCLGHNATAYNDAESEAGMDRLLAWAGLEAPHIGKLLLTKRIGQNREAWFLTNPERETVTEIISLPAGKKASDLFGAAPERAGNGANGVKITVEPLDVKVLVVE
jgi:hypothetical protein